jgi:hypothetical protein
MCTTTSRDSTSLPCDINSSFLFHQHSDLLAGHTEYIPNTVNSGFRELRPLGGTALAEWVRSVRRTQIHRTTGSYKSWTEVPQAPPRLRVKLCTNLRRARAASLALLLTLQY